MSFVVAWVHLYVCLEIPHFFNMVLSVWQPFFTLSLPDLWFFYGSSHGSGSQASRAFTNTARRQVKTNKEIMYSTDYSCDISVVLTGILSKVLLVSRTSCPSGSSLVILFLMSPAKSFVWFDKNLSFRETMKLLPDFSDHWGTRPILELSSKTVLTCQRCILCNWKQHWKHCNQEEEVVNKYIFGPI